MCILDYYCMFSIVSQINVVLKVNFISSHGLSDVNLQPRTASLGNTGHQPDSNTNHFRK